MYYTTRKDQRDAIRALIADPGFASRSGQREAELEKMLHSALNELDAREKFPENVFTSTLVLMSDPPTEEEIEKELRVAQGLLADKRIIQKTFKTPDFIVDRNIAQKYAIPLEEARRLLALAEASEQENPSYYQPKSEVES